MVAYLETCFSSSFNLESLSLVNKLLP